MASGRPESSRGVPVRPISGERIGGLLHDPVLDLLDGRVVQRKERGRGLTGPFPGDLRRQAVARGVLDHRDLPFDVRGHGVDAGEERKGEDKGDKPDPLHPFGSPYLHFPFPVLPGSPRLPDREDCKEGAMGKSRKPKENQ